jgi:hypothetical protein
MIATERVTSRSATDHMQPTPNKKAASVPADGPFIIPNPTAYFLAA